MSRDSIREKFFASSNRRKELFEIALGGEKVVVEIRQPTIAKRTKILDLVHASKDTKPTVAELEEAKMLALLTCAYDPDEGKPLFDERDRENIIAQPDAFDTLAQRCIDVMNAKTGKAAERVEDLGKNCEATTSAP